DQGTGPADRRDMPLGHRAFPRPAALARPESGRLGRIGGRVERDVFAARLARGAARPAIDAGSAHRIEKASVLRRVMRDHGGPALFVVQHGNLSATRHDANLARRREGLYPTLAF